MIMRILWCDAELCFPILSMTILHAKTVIRMYREIHSTNPVGQEGEDHCEQ